MQDPPSTPKKSRRTIHGTIRYTSKKPDRLDQERGRETFTMTRHPDGKVTIRARCEIDEPSPTVLRDVLYSIDEAGRPMDCLLRLTLGDQFIGAGFFRMGKDFIECDSYGPNIGRLSQHVKIEGHNDGFGAHPIVLDGHNTNCMDFARGPHKREKRSFMTSLDHRGATPPLIAEKRIYLAYLGDETVTVEAGVFHCRHLCFTDDDLPMTGADGGHPVYNVWVTADEDNLFVQGGVGGYMQTWYELVQLDRPPIV